MTTTEHMLEVTPGEKPAQPGDLSQLVDTLSECASLCTICADACLAEEHVAMLRRCITLDLDCADICTVTGRVITRSGMDEPMLLHLTLDACREICRACGEECGQHAESMEHCRLCAESCRRCELACAEVVNLV